MVIKVPIYVDYDSKGIPQELVPEIASLISEKLTEHLQAKLPKSKSILKFHDEDGDLLERTPFNVVTRREAIDRFR